ncbi:MAG: hypothetical protein AAB932_02620 [Patescibacteria group bacterium]
MAPVLGAKEVDHPASFVPSFDPSWAKTDEPCQGVAEGGVSAC